VAAAQQAVAARKAGAPLKFFTRAQHHTADVLSELIIRADDRSPDAKGAHVADYIDFALSEATPEARQAWIDGLAALDTASATKFGTPSAGATIDVKNLFVLDGSIVVSAFCQNPTWTILALRGAARNAWSSR
jgi:hypothetical protein